MTAIYWRDHGGVLPVAVDGDPLEVEAAHVLDGCVSFKLADRYWRVPLAYVAAIEGDL